MKFKLTRYIGRSVLALVVTAMLTFGGLLIVTPNSDNAQAQQPYQYKVCHGCNGHTHS